MKALTNRQREVLDAIVHRFVETGHYPTHRELAAHFDCVTRSISAHIEAIERKGYLTRIPDVARGLALSRELELQALRGRLAKIEESP